MEAKQGICKGGSLSVVLGTLYLLTVDKECQRMGIHYYRYLDDIIIFIQSRHKLRRALKILYNELTKLRLKLSEPKTFIGKVCRGFSFLGYQFSGASAPITVSEPTVQRFKQRLVRLYEQRASDARVAAYIRRWQRWVTSGLEGYKVSVPTYLSKEFTTEKSQTSGSDIWRMS